VNIFRNLNVQLYALRCRLGAWLLREHVGALCEHYNQVGAIAAQTGQGKRKERVDYIGIGLRYTVGSGTSWRRFDAEHDQRMRESAEKLRHAADVL
jgi:hypothetical protein